VKAIKYLALAVATAIAMALGLTSCNVTRTITSESRSLTRGDTAIVIQTKTIESYNAMKN
jgi:predicted lysophospholipase L1 biosynthesis ABC-type transport system permease subunit